MPSQEPSIPIRSQERSAALHPGLRKPGDIDPNWPYFVSLYSEEGFRWAEEYGRREHVQLMEQTTQSLNLLRRRKIGPGLELLGTVEAGLAKIEREAPVFFHVLGRWYFGALAYYYYCIEDFSGAARALDAAYDSVQRAVEIKRFLVPFASHCHDFWIQRIRIHRNQRRWDDMRRAIEMARQTVTGERPYCVLSDGTPIDVAAIQSFYRSITPFTEEEKVPLRLVFDDELRLLSFRYSLAEIYAMPGFVIPYRPAHGRWD